MRKIVVAVCVAAGFTSSAFAQGLPFIAVGSDGFVRSGVVYGHPLTPLTPGRPSALGGGVPVGGYGPVYRNYPPPGYWPPEPTPFRYPPVHDWRNEPPAPGK